MSRRDLTVSDRRTAKRAHRRARRLLVRFRDDRRGATAVEYVLVAGLVFLAIVGALRIYADRVSAMFNYIANTIAR